jgi:hypothetical protein
MEKLNLLEIYVEFLHAIQKLVPFSFAESLFPVGPAVLWKALWESRPQFLRIHSNMKQKFLKPLLSANRVAVDN